MRRCVLCLIFLVGATAIPNGYYHQEYNYKTSSSSYKNNELQRKTDDQGYYRKDGDLEGKTRPRIDANSEHSEYLNPNLRNNQYTYGSSGSQLASTGHNYGTYENDLAEGIVSNDRSSKLGTRNAGAYTSNNYGAGSFGTKSYNSNNYGSSSQSYQTSSSLRALVLQIQQELESQLQETVRNNNEYNSRLDINQLEEELRKNLTEKLTDELNIRYGPQSIRSGMSYSIRGGRVQNTANYDNQELVDLRVETENKLLDQLRQQYSSSSSIGSRYQSYDHTQRNYGFTTTPVPPAYHTLYPSLPRASYADDHSFTNYQTSRNNFRYSPIPNPESISNIVTRVQSKLDDDLNNLLDDIQKRYFSSNAAYSLTNTDVLLERIQNELKGNLTVLVDDNIRNNYGNQVEKDGYMYSIAPNGQTSQQYNYAVRDLSNFKDQVERNLLDKLRREFESQKTRWATQQTHNSQSSYGSYSIAPRYNIYTTPQYAIYTTPRPAHVIYPTPEYNAPLVGNTRSSSNQYNYGANYGIKGGSSHSSSSNSITTSMAQLQNQLQTDLSRQLQAAINREHFNSGGSTVDYSPQSYQSSLQQLQDELNRNLTRNLQEYSASGSYAAYGNFDESQMASIKNQLESNLKRQLQQGLQQSFQSHSYGSSSSSSGSSSLGSYYRPVREFQPHTYNTGLNNLQGQDCLEEEPNSYNIPRSKRSYIPNAGRFSSSTNDQIELGQEIDNSQTEELAQQIDDSDLVQQHEDSDFTKIEVGSSHNQLVDSNVGKLEFENQHPAQEEERNQVSDLTQQIEDSGYEKLQTEDQYQHQGQIEDDFDTTQNMEHSGFELPQLSKPKQKNIYNQYNDQETGIRRLQLENPQTTVLNQEKDDSDVVQNIEHPGFETFQQNLIHSSGSQIVDPDLEQIVQQPEAIELSQQEQTEFDEGRENLDFEYQQSELGTGRLQIGSQSKRSDVNLDEVVNRLERTLSMKLQELKTNLPAQSRVQINQLRKQLETYVTIPDGLNQQQSDYIRNEIKNYILQELEKEFGEGFEYDTDRNIPSVNQMNDYTFRVDKYGDLNKKQIKKCEDIEQSLLADLHFAVKNIPTGLPRSDEQLQKLKDELNTNITKILKQEHHLFTSVQIYKIQRQFELDLSHQLEDLFKTIRPQRLHYTTTKFDLSGNTEINEALSLNSWNIQGFDEKQVHFCQYLEDTLTKKLTDSINTLYINNNSPYKQEPQILYHQLLREINKNITDRLNGFSEYFLKRYMAFDQNKLLIIHKKLEYNLELKLRKDLPVTSLEIHNGAKNTPQTVDLEDEQYLSQKQLTNFMISENGEEKSSSIEQKADNIQIDQFSQTPTAINFNEIGQKPVTSNQLFNSGIEREPVTNYQNKNEQSQVQLEQIPEVNNEYFPEQHGHSIGTTSQLRTEYPSNRDTSDVYQTDEYSSHPIHVYAGYGNQKYPSPYDSRLNPTYNERTTVLNNENLQQIEENTELTSNIERLQPIYVNRNIHSSQVPSYNGGVKGRRRFDQSTQPNQVEDVIPIETDTTVTTNDENLPWWKRLGNKVKAGANKLKEKLVG